MVAEEPQAAVAASEPCRRLFFALWPDEAMRQAMERATRKAARASGGRPVPAASLHVTLAFLGSVPERRLPQLAAIAREAAGQPGGGAAHIELRFEHLDYWRAAHLLCALPAEPSVATLSLARRLRDALAAGGFSPDLKPFRPHVTVARKVSRPGRLEKMLPVAWSFAELALVASQTLPECALYSVIESYPLCSEQKAANNIEKP